MARFFVGVGPQRWNTAFDNLGRGHRAAIGEHNHVGFIFKGYMVIRQMVMLCELPDHLPKALLWALRTCFEQEFCQCDPPGFLLSTMLAGDLVHPSFNRFSQSEVVPVEGQYLFVADCVENPLIIFRPSAATFSSVGL